MCNPSLFHRFAMKVFYLKRVLPGAELDLVIFSPILVDESEPFGSRVK
jgi:hypothetical protein